MSKDDAISIMNNIKMNEETYYETHRDVILKRAKDYCENDKERLREQAKNKYKYYLKKKKI